MNIVFNLIMLIKKICKIYILDIFLKLKLKHLNINIILFSFILY